MLDHFCWEKDMNKFLWVTSLVFLSICSAAMCNAQHCASTFEQIKLMCTDGKGCERTAIEDLPTGSDDFEYSCGAISCCGQLITTCNIVGPCEDLKLRDPAISDQLGNLAERYKVLVADCAGQYVRYSLHTLDGTPPTCFPSIS